MLRVNREYLPISTFLKNCPSGSVQAPEKKYSLLIFKNGDGEYVVSLPYKVVIEMVVFVETYGTTLINPVGVVHVGVRPFVVLLGCVTSFSDAHR